MYQNPPEPRETQRSNIAELARRWAAHVAVAATVGVAFYLVAEITSWGTAFQPDKVSLFWAPTGVSCGLLIVLGPRRRWPATAGLVAASAMISHETWNNPWITPAVAACNAVEALTVAGVFTRYFGGADFPLDRTRNILGLLGAAAIGALASSLIATAVLRLALGPSIVVLFTLRHWFASVFLGIVIVTPLVIGLADAVRHPPSRREYIEGTLALLSLAVLTLIIVSLPRESWEILLPVAWPFPILLWLAGRSRPVFAAAGAFLVSNIIVWTTIFGIGHFGDATIPLGDRVAEAQAAILFLAISAYVLAALFAERRGSEALLTRSNTMLERERNNRLMNIEAITASIVHEVKQPLTAIAANGGATLAFLEKTPPELGEAIAGLRDIVDDTHNANRALNAIRTLVQRVDHAREPIDVNEIALEALQSTRSELAGHGVAARPQMIKSMPPIHGNRSQLLQVIVNLIHNAVEAMDSTDNQRRLLTMKTGLRQNAVELTVEDSGPGIDPDRLEAIFDVFVTSKAHGMGLGLAICRTIIERHGGQLNAFSDGKTGASFEVLLPIGSPAAGAAEAE